MSQDQKKASGKQQQGADGALPTKDQVTSETTSNPLVASNKPTDKETSSSQTSGGRLLDARRLYIVLTSLIGVAFVALIGGLYVANNLLASKSSNIAEARQSGNALDKKLQQVARARADIAKYQTLAAIAKQIVPQDKDQAQTVREITRLAKSSNILLGEVSFPSSTLGDDKTPHSQLKIVTGIPGVYSLQITVKSDAAAPVAYGNLLQFLDALEHNRRTALVDSITIQPESGSPDKLSFTIVLNEYIKP